MPRIHVFPAWRDNPYLNMLYLGVRSEGWSVDGTTDAKGLIQSIAGLRAGDILHIHWTSPICQAQPSHEEARAALARFQAAVDDGLSRGVRVLWTVHNAIPHSTPYPDLEIALSQYLCDVAERIIQISPHTAAIVSEFYRVPDGKVVTLRHASYAGVYADPPTRAHARAQLGVPESSPVFAFVGQILPYKGVPTLFGGLEILSTTIPDLTLLLAGRTNPKDIPALDAALPSGVRVVRQHSFLPDAEIGTWFAAADVMVFPYQRILNSGSMFLSATFGRPCILPAEPHLVTEFGEEPWVSFFDPSPSPTWSLASAMRQALASSSEAATSAHAFAAGYTTFDMAWDYVRLVSSAAGKRETGTAGESETP